MADIPYTLLHKFFHRLVLGNKAVSELLLDIELMSGDALSRKIVQEKHVFVSGLARGGTTILLRELYGTGCFGSLTYRDMPMVLAPRLWRRLSGFSGKNTDPVERAHGDGIMVDYDSPEAFEEVFWKTSDSQYIHDDALVPHHPSGEVVGKFLKYVGGILASRGKGCNRYLSKNNNNILRLPILRKAFPACVVLIPFRNPLQHAASLWRQHLRFLNKYENDPFTKEYMGLLGHYEFGPGLKPFVFGDQAPKGNPAELDYWLSQWLVVYSWLANEAPDFCRFLSYERMCGDLEAQKRLQSLCDLQQSVNFGASFEMQVRPVDINYSRELIDSCNNVYHRIVDKESLWLDCAC